MRTLLKNGNIINVFLDQIMESDILIEDDRIIGLGSYNEEDADEMEDITGKYVCPGFIDGHVHIESSMLSPEEFVRVCLPHGTTTVIADPHEIANVAGINGIGYMIEATEHVPMGVYFMVPSCVPATQFDESGAVLTSYEIQSFFHHPRILGLGEMMNYPGVIFKDEDVLSKIDITKKYGMITNGHAPMLSGHDLDRYIAAGIYDDHECSTIEEAREKMQKGQWIMIRQGTAARNLDALIDLFDEPYNRRCMLVTDDKHPADLLQHGHIDNIIRLAASKGKSVLAGIRMATLQAAQHFGLKEIGAIAPGYVANLLILDDLVNVQIRDVYYKGKLVVENGMTHPFQTKKVRGDFWKAVRNSFYLKALTAESFHIKPEEGDCRVIRVIPKQLLTKEEILPLNFIESNGIDVSKDILKIAVVERHMDSGHIGLGFIIGMGLREGAIASSVSHDSHNLIVAGCNEEDMALAGNCVREMGGGLAVVRNGQIISAMALPIGGLMGKKSAAEMARQNQEIREAVAEIGSAEGIDPFMNLAFVSLPVIPDLKLTTFGLVDVNKQELVPLFVK
ncbi:MAG: adenine deaminase [Eubacteriales bacterium]|nr:adenine deaminase [Eubacteriales bacterium]